MDAPETPIRILVRDTPQGASFLVRVQPRASRNAVTGVWDEALRISLSTPPIEGRANEALILFLAERLKVARGSITIAAGEHARNKRICIAGRSAAQVQAALENL